MTNELDRENPFLRINAAVEALWTEKPDSRENVLAVSEDLRELVASPTSNVAQILRGLFDWYSGVRDLQRSVTDIAASNAESAKSIEVLRSVAPALRDALKTLVINGEASRRDARQAVEEVERILNSFERLPADVARETPLRELQDDCLRVMIAAGYGSGPHATSIRKAAELLRDAAKVYGLDFNVQSMCTYATPLLREFPKRSFSGLDGVIKDFAVSRVRLIEGSMGQDSEPEI